MSAGRNRAVRSQRSRRIARPSKGRKGREPALQTAWNPWTSCLKGQGHYVVWEAMESVVVGGGRFEGDFGVISGTLMPLHPGPGLGARGGLPAPGRAPPRRSQIGEGSACKGGVGGGGKREKGG